jgi:2-polyprenyl-6-methoxyphenol hydroxylase-like FAD-dependent oxidoreductase
VSATEPIDVLIIGGGVAGSSLACVLAEDGLSVAVVERETVFRDKVKGEGLHPWGYREVKALSLEDQLFKAWAKELPVWQLYTNRIADEPHLWSSDDVNPLPEVTVPHPALQEALIRQAAQRGVQAFRGGKAALISTSNPTVVEISVGAQRKAFSPRLIVGADGRNSTVRRWMKAKLVRDPQHHWLGGGLFEGFHLNEGSTHGANFEGGRTFVFPQGDGVARAYLVASNAIAEAIKGPKRAARFVQSCEDALPEGAFRGARPIGPIAFVPDNDVWSDVIARRPFVLLGDAAGANDPSLGQGLSIVFRDVRELRELLHESNDWNSAISEFEARRRRYFEVLRAHAMWTGILTIDFGDEAETRRELVTRARESDPTAGGFAMIFSRGPDGLDVSESSRRHFFGEDFD